MNKKREQRAQESDGQKDGERGREKKKGTKSHHNKSGKSLSEDHTPGGTEVNKSA